MLYSFKYVCLPVVSYSWPMLLHVGGDREEERVHHPTRMRGRSLWYVYVCVCHVSWICCMTRGVLLICAMLC